MGKRIDKVKTFVNEYAEVVGYTIGAATMICCGVMLGNAMKKRVETTIAALPPVREYIPIPDSLAAFGVDIFDNYTGAVEVMASNYTVSVSELGKFGEALCSVENITPDNKAFVLVNVAKTLKED